MSDMLGFTEDNGNRNPEENSSQMAGELFMEDKGQEEQTPSVATEAELVAAARTGDVLAFGELIQRSRSACLKRAMLMIRNRSDAEDEVQNAFWKAFQRLEQFRGEGTFAAWLSRIVENQCLMRIREERNSHFVYLDETSESNVRLELVGRNADPEDQLGLDELVKLLRTEVSRIPPLLRNVMLLRDLEQLSMPDVATRLGLSVPAAKSRLMRARMELRSRIAKHCGRKGPGTLMQMARYSQAAYTRAS
jgi:RNA polymerase sigma-70 factor (ECF subfamily)